MQFMKMNFLEVFGRFSSTLGYPMSTFIPSSPVGHGWAKLGNCFWIMCEIVGFGLGRAKQVGVFSMQYLPQEYRSQTL